MKDKLINIALATGSKELNDDIVTASEEPKQKFNFKQIHYREFFLDPEIKFHFDICVISQRLDGEESLEKIIYKLRTKNIRVIIITTAEEKEDLKICMKYSVTDIILQPVTALKILKVIKKPKTFADISYLYEGIDIDINTDKIKSRIKKKNMFSVLKKEKTEKSEPVVHERDIEENKKSIEKPKQIENNEKQEEIDSLEKILQKYETGNDPFEDIEEEKQEENKEEQKEETQKIKELQNELDFGQVEEESKPKQEEKDNQIKTKVKVVKEYTLLRTKSVGIISLSHGAGATFLAVNLAKAVSNLKIPIAVIEPPIEKPYIFDTVGIEQKIYEEGQNIDFYSFSHAINSEEEIQRENENKIDGIYWIIPDPRLQTIEKWDDKKMFKLANIPRKSQTNIIDIGNNFEHESIKELLWDIDIILAVIDPLPVEIINNEDKLVNLLQLKEKGLNIHFVINKWNTGIDKRKLLKFLDVKPLSYIPFVNPELMYKATYDCKIPYEDKNIKEQLEQPLDKIIKLIIPSDFLKYKKNKNKKRKSLFKF